MARHQVRLDVQEERCIEAYALRHDLSKPVALKRLALYAVERIGAETQLQHAGDLLSGLSISDAAQREELRLLRRQFGDVTALLINLFALEQGFRQQENPALVAQIRSRMAALTNARSILDPGHPEITS